MTEKLYYKNSYLKKFKANIKNHFEKEGEFHLILDKTAFYPEGGGQPADKGFIGGEQVKYVYEDKGKIYHIVDDLPEEKNKLECKIDWERRFDHMQQHTGQHVLSAIFEEIANANTIGFHLGEEEVTIDLDKKLDNKMIDRVETKVNELIYKNKNIKANFPSEKELENIELRKEPKVEENIRVVIIDDIDLCACGGTHLKQTGEIGILSIIDSENYKEGMRIRFLAGKRALKDYRFKNNLIADARTNLSVKNKDILSEIIRLKEDLDDKNKEIDELKDQLFDFRVKEIINNAEEIGDHRLISGEYNNLDSNELKLMANKLVDFENNIIIIGQGKEDKVRVIMGKSANIEKLDMNEMITDVMKVLDGNGGGHEFFAQGGGSKVEELNNAIEKAKKLIKSEIN